ncbi:MAG: glycosyltransferase family 4 protein [Cyanobacteria bacterium J06600_6]
MSYRFKLWSEKTRNVFTKALGAKVLRKTSDSRQFKLLIITQFFPPDYAATGQLISELSHQLSEQNIEVNVFTGQPGYAYQQEQAPKIEVDRRVKIRRTTFRQFYSQRIRSKTLNGAIFTLRSAWHLLRNARQYNAVILTTAPPFLAVVGYLANLVTKLEYICLVYDLYPDVVIELGVISPNNAIAKLWHKINGHIWQRSQEIVVLSETMKHRIVAQHPTIANQISVIHNWADPNWIEPISKAENWFAQQHQLRDKFTVLYSGNLGHCHDMDTILETAKLLREQEIQFVFIGAGAKYQKCQAMVAELKLGNCLFLPYQDRANLPYSLTACDLALVSIAPGLEGVVAPSKVYGIMAAGKAIAAVCESHSYLRQLISDAHCGVAVDNHHSQQLAEFILILAANPDLAKDMGDAGRNYLQQHFTPQKIAQQYCSVLRVNNSSLDCSKHELFNRHEHILYGMVDNQPTTHS